MIVKDLVEGSTSYIEDDEELLLKEINLSKYKNLWDANRDLAVNIIDDRTFCDVEWNLFQLYYSEKGFTEDDMEYAVCCGYCTDQFGEGR